MTKITDERLADAEWLEHAARYFEKRDTGGEDMAFWANVANAERCRSIAQSLRAQGGVRVKPLQWVESIPGRLHADPYMLERVHLDDWGIYVWRRGEKRSISGHHELEEAKAAAQADYERRILSSLAASPAPVSEHPDDLAVDRFAAAMKAKLAKKREEGRGGWESKDECSAEFLSQLLREHVEKGDPLDVGNLSMMLHQRGDAISPGPVSEEMVLMPRALDGVALHSLANYLGYTHEETDELYSEIVSRAALAAKGGQ